MSLTIIAMAGILVGFLCLMAGFFMEGADHRRAPSERAKRTRPVKKQVPARRKKMA